MRDDSEFPCPDHAVIPQVQQWWMMGCHQEVVLPFVLPLTFHDKGPLRGLVEPENLSPCSLLWTCSRTGWQRSG